MVFLITSGFGDANTLNGPGWKVRRWLYLATKLPRPPSNVRILPISGRSSKLYSDIQGNISDDIRYKSIPFWLFHLTTSIRSRTFCKANSETYLRPLLSKVFLIIPRLVVIFFSPRVILIQAYPILIPQRYKNLFNKQQIKLYLYMMGDEQEKSAKIFFLLNSVLESKAKYIEVSKDGNVLFKVKLVVDDKDFIHILDSFFDDGLSVKKIEKENFDSFNGVETLEFNF